MEYIRFISVMSVDDIGMKTGMFLTERGKSMRSKKVYPKRLSSFQVVIPRETALKSLRLETPRRQPFLGIWSSIQKGK